MPRYRAYILDEHGHLVGAVDLECADDEEAKERAKRLDSHRVELWRQVPLLDLTVH
ncbi:hypothetical protein [Bradyrhizobium sp. Ec3.3]|uniref:hypothetical protein n=1 Tax=Bradyrhizobium sp. Ec3.3 TaxID=189753 RepID=UPI0018DC6C53|nr:hypothetical protein [Bradyrhizobium sp. Ec3.3]